MAHDGPGWRARLHSAKIVLKKTYSSWDEDQAARLAASLALYTLLSLSPLLVIVVSIAGLVFGASAARQQISQQIEGVVGPRAGQAIQSLVAHAHAPSAGIISTIIGIAILLLGASGVFGELQSALNLIWRVKPKPNRGIRGLILDRFFSFSMVMGVAFLLLVSLVISAALAAISGYLEHLIALPVLWYCLNWVVGLALSTLLFAITFKVVPDVRVGWRDILVGGFVTALAFSIGKALLAWYVGRSATTSPFGAAGSLVALIVWVYYSAQILFLGAEFARTYAIHTGSHIAPAPNAVAISAEEAHEQAPGNAPQRRAS
ncbi:MAG TPA: YihY/virulence factor BrkB family protein [Polyangiaceae bacterium]|nr:YihY/virulence factor BrkB family protein [Polyangiaceae bacterium]